MQGQVCHTEHRAGYPHSFIIAPYAPSPDGCLLPISLPNACPEANEGGPACVVKVHCSRKRDTGPRHPLVIVHCKTHNCFFTLYPPGFIPYGREPIARLAPDGTRLFQEDNTEEKAKDGDLEILRGTVFDAALDAAQGTAWSRGEPNERVDLRWQSQRRNLEKAMRVVGVAPELKERVLEEIAVTLDVPMMDLLEGKQSVLARPGYKTRGQATKGILQEVIGKGCAVERLAIAGHLGGLWGKPHWWDPQAGLLRKVPFRLPGTEGVIVSKLCPERINELET